ncbi:unnamed protein product [marine sediment metagenome]|uniref:DNA methylase N-4/N-6 domain-containing protein n=1 Tax=marine sediment metagenome TaxID=412755 RepID=X0YDS0_9ZZZZ
MPSSVKDRLTNAYEHIFLFAKARRYYFDLDAIRKPHTSDGEYRNKLRAGKEKYTGKGAWSIHEFGSTSVFNMGSSIHPKGKNPGDVWCISTLPFPGAHFATFPPKLITPIIKAGCPKWICSSCGKPRERIRLISRPTYPSKEDPTLKTGRAGLNRYREGVSHKRLNIGQRKIAEKLRELAKNRFVEMRKCFGSKWDHWIRTDDSGARVPMLDDWIELKRIFPSLEIFDSYIISEPKEGWSDCGCGEGWVGGIVLDPFAGSGTALRVARKLGRRFIGIEINQEYAAMCERRVRADKYTPPPEDVQPLTEIFENE